MNKIKISQGPTFKGLIAKIGSIILVFGFIITLKNLDNISSSVFVIGALLIFLGIILFFSIRGVLIDIEKKVVKPYFDIIFSKLGSWESLDNYNKIILIYENESQTMNSRANTTNYVTKSYDIFLIADNKKQLMLKEFTNHEKAKFFLNEYSLLLEKESIDHYELMIERIQERRPSVRR